MALDIPNSQALSVLSNLVSSVGSTLNQKNTAKEILTSNNIEKLNKVLSQTLDNILVIISPVGKSS